MQQRAYPHSKAVIMGSNTHGGTLFELMDAGKGRAAIGHAAGRDTRTGRLRAWVKGKGLW